MKAKILKLFKKLSDGILLYIPQLLFGIIAPILIYQYENAAQNMLGFYTATFGIGLLSSGYANTCQYLTRREDSHNSIFGFYNSYIISRFVLLSPLFVIDVNFVVFEFTYTKLLIVFIILGSLPSWGFLFLLGKRKLPIFLAWLETILKISILAYVLEQQLPVWYFVVGTVVINIFITLYVILKYKSKEIMKLRAFLQNYIPFITSGVLFSLSWLTFMSIVLVNYTHTSTIVVFLERTLRILERASAVITTVLFRKDNNVYLTSGVKTKFKAIIKWSLMPVVVFSLVGSIYWQQHAVFFILCIINVLIGQLAQQLFNPNRWYNLGGVLAALTLLLPIIFIPKAELYGFELFTLGTLLNYLIRRSSLLSNTKGQQ
ncbi:hypothetical protein KO505_07225 [Psychrosphaera sp. F3M07]|uniref:hypothetical protein n=1 Tax=Psychrosphaera sp. F3M07 TaxID=2841560 RepID=UPI001C097924|nr:hypothetical protein [Psychrosphaera sp. F3M07]MBU2917753.1 hypothetical protein [Psychrosphaera sp. F3M07]